MYLMRLQSKEKFSFLQLAHYLARIDNNYGKKEEEMILEYCAEMGIENLDNFDENSFSLDKILNDFKSTQSKKIVVLELMILIHIDSDFHINEKVLIEKIVDKFKLSSEEINDYSIWGKSVAKLYDIGKNYLEK